MKIDIMMAEVAGNSARQAEESTNRMEEMKKQSEAIEVSGAELVEEMKQLKDKVQVKRDVDSLWLLIKSVSWLNRRSSLQNRLPRLLHN